MVSQLDGAYYHLANSDAHMQSGHEWQTRTPQQPITYARARVAPTYVQGPTYGSLIPNGFGEAAAYQPGPMGDQYTQEVFSDEQFEEDFSNPPYTGRAVLFLSVLGLGGATLYSMISGRISVLSHPLNYRGLACGWDQSVRHLPFVYYPIDPKDGKLASLMPRRPMCVQRCPDTTDVAKKAYLSISDASAVSVGQSLALLSVLHSMRSPVYASATDYSSYCVPDAPAMRAQFESIVSASRNYNATGLRSMAATIVSGIPSSVLAAIVAAASSHFVPKIIWFYTLIDRSGAALGAIIIALAGTSALFRYGQWVSGLVCIAYATSLIVQMVLNKNVTTRGGRFMSELAPCIKALPLTEPILMAFHILALSTIYSTLMAFSFLQTSNYADAGEPLDFALDPNGGLKIYPLEMNFTESRRVAIFNYIQSIGVIALGGLILEYLLRFYSTLVVLVTLKVHEGDGGSAPEEEHYDKPAEIALSRSFAGVKAILQNTFELIQAKMLLPFALISRFMNQPFFSERLERLENNSALIQYCLDNLACPFDRVDRLNYTMSEELARASLSMRPGFMNDLNDLASIGSQVSFLVTACIFTLTYSIFLIISSFGGMGVTTKSPFLSSLMVTFLFSYIPKMGISSSALSAEALLYAYAVRTDMCRPIADNTWNAVQLALKQTLQSTAGTPRAPATNF